VSGRISRRTATGRKRWGLDALVGLGTQQASGNANAASLFEPKLIQQLGAVETRRERILDLVALEMIEGRVEYDLSARGPSGEWNGDAQRRNARYPTKHSFHG
jgi:hypothetical protein